MRQPMLKAIASFILVAASVAPRLWRNPCTPRSINYIEDRSPSQASLDSKAIGTDCSRVNRLYSDW